MSEKSEPKKLRNLYIANLDYNSTEDSLTSHFKQWGEIENCVVMRDPQTRKSRGFGFLTYKLAHMVDDAQAARPHKIDGRELYLRRKNPSENSDKPEAHVKVNDLFVSSINEDLNEEDLREYFGPYGHIVEVNITTGKNKIRFALVKFDDYDPVDKILLHSHNYKGSELRVRKYLPQKVNNTIKRKEEMRGLGRGVGGLEKRRTTDQFDRVSYGVEYRGSCGDRGYGGVYNNGRSVWKDGYGVTYTSDEGGGNFGLSYGGVPIRGNTDYVHRSQGPYGDGRGSGGFGGQ